MYLFQPRSQPWGERLIVAPLPAFLAVWVYENTLGGHCKTHLPTCLNFSLWDGNHHEYLKLDCLGMIVVDAIHCSLWLFSMKYGCPDTVLFLPPALDQCRQWITVWGGIWEGSMGKGAAYICPVSIATIGLGLEILLSFNYLQRKKKPVVGCWAGMQWGCIRHQVLVTTGWQRRSEESSCFLCYSFFSASEKWNQA